MIYYIENDYLKVGINSFGGSLTSIYNKLNNHEMLYQPRENGWSGQDAVIFPFVGRLKNKEYTVNNKKYSMEIHGLIRYTEVEVTKHEDEKIILKYESNENSLKNYPFKFIFNIIYTLNDNKLSVKYEVVNNDEKTLYYGVGGHPAFICDGCDLDDYFDISGNYITIETDKQIGKIELNEQGTFIVGKGNEVCDKTIHLSKEYIMKEKTLIIDSSNIKNVTLNRINKDKVIISLYDCNYLAFWTDEKHGNFIAIEPWWSLPDYEEDSIELSEKPSILSLESGKSKVHEYVITIE